MNLGQLSHVLSFESPRFYINTKNNICIYGIKIEANYLEKRGSGRGEKGEGAV